MALRRRRQRHRLRRRIRRLGVLGAVLGAVYAYRNQQLAANDQRRPASPWPSETGIPQSRPPT